MAKYTTSNQEGNRARVAIWNVKAVMGEDEINIDANGNYVITTDGYYEFTIVVEQVEVKAKYGVVVSLTDETGAKVWPEDVEVKLMSQDGLTEIGTSTTGIFDDLGYFEPATFGSVTYRLYVKAGYATASGQYGLNIKATIEQIL